MRKTIFTLLTFSLFACNSKKEPVIFVSPSGNIKAAITVDDVYLTIQYCTHYHLTDLPKLN